MNLNLSYILCFVFCNTFRYFNIFIIKNVLYTVNVYMVAFTLKFCQFILNMPLKYCSLVISEEKNHISSKRSFLSLIIYIFIDNISIFCQIVYLFDHCMVKMFYNDTCCGILLQSTNLIPALILPTFALR